MFYWTKSQSITLPISFVVVLAIAVCICLLTRKKSYFVRVFPIILISTTLIILEIAKQIITAKEGYDFWAVPLHFCSLFLYFLPLACLKGKVGDFGKMMTIICSVAFMIIMYSNPTSVLGDACDNIFYDFHSAHTFIYHHLLLLAFFILIGSKLYSVSKLDYLYAPIGILLYGMVAVPFAHYLSTNFCNLLYNEDIPILENIRILYGQVAYTFAMFLLGVVGAILIVLIVHLISILKQKIKKQN